MCNDTQLFRFLVIHEKKNSGLGIIKIIILSSQKKYQFSKINKNYQVKKDKLNPSKEDKLK